MKANIAEVRTELELGWGLPRNVRLHGPTYLGGKLRWPRARTSNAASARSGDRLGQPMEWFASEAIDGRPGARRARRAVSKPAAPSAERSDRRASRVALTESCRRTLAAADRTYEAELARILDPELDEEEQRAVHDLVARVLMAASDGEPA